MSTYEVKPGDTLGEIARRYGVTASALAEANQLEDPNLIQAGLALTIPPSSTDAMELAGLPPPVGPPAGLAGLAVNRTRFRLPAVNYYPQAAPKDLIVLHFTAGGSVAGAFAAWSATPSKVATAYIVDTDGTIYEVFPPQCWAYHLGLRGSAFQNGTQDRRAIAIEMVNVGPLRPDPRNAGQLNFWAPSDPRTGRPTFGTPFCQMAETERFVKTVYRGEQYYAAFPQGQVKSVAKLVRALANEFRIPMVLPPEERRDLCDVAYFSAFKGIASHQNFREDKFDVGPAYPWSSLR
jgi:LysM repeat protein